MSTLSQQAEADYIYDNTQAFQAGQRIHEQVEVLSLDIWNTLLRRNIKFSQRRNELFRTAMLGEEYQNDHGTHLVATAIKTGDLLVDAIQETRGIQYGFTERLEIIEQQLTMLLVLDGASAVEGFEEVQLTQEELSALEQRTYEVFRAFPPTLIEEGVVDMLNWFQEHIPVALVSNTGFIPGHVMRDVLKDLGLPTQYLYFSDEVEFAKPSPEIFTNLMRLPGLTDAKNVLHIGDSYSADYMGAQLAQLSAVLYDPNASFIIKDGDDTPALAWKGPDEVMTVRSLLELSQVIAISTSKTVQ